MRPLGPFGAEVVGLDLEDEGSLDAAASKALRRAWVDHGILLFRNALHSQEAHLRLSRVFGQIQPEAMRRIGDDRDACFLTMEQRPGDASHDTFTLVDIDGQQRTGWLGWHWDQAFTLEIVRGAVLRMITPARIDGRTGFIDTAAAYERLAPAVQQRIDGLEVVYRFTPAQEANRFGFPRRLRVLQRHPRAEQVLDQQRRKFPPVVHPLVITQRETGRKILRLSPMHAQCILGMAPAESDELLQTLAEHLVDMRFAYFHTWQADDAIVWDNWRTIHCTTGVPFDVERLAQRTTLLGDDQRGRYLDLSHGRGASRRRFDD